VGTSDVVIEGDIQVTSQRAAADPNFGLASETSPLKELPLSMLDGKWLAILYLFALVIQDLL